MAPVISPVVSVLIPVRDGEAFLDAALDSVLSQTLSRIEVIVIDDASADGTADLVRRRSAQDRRLRLVEAKKNVGPGAARALGLETARGDWIAILDADDRLAPDRLERLVAIADREGLDAIADNLALLDAGEGEVVGQAFPLAEDAFLALTLERFLDGVRPAARINLGWMQPMVRRDYLERHAISWPPLRHAEDMVFSARVLLHGGRFWLVGHPTYVYTQRRGTRSGRRSAASRTRRSAEEQHSALALVASELDAAGVSARLRKRLAGMYGEIAATTIALNLRDSWDDRNLPAVLAELVRLGPNAAGLARCLLNRYARGTPSYWAGDGAMPGA